MEGVVIEWEVDDDDVDNTDGGDVVGAMSTALVILLHDVTTDRIFPSTSAFTLLVRITWLVLDFG